MIIFWNSDIRSASLSGSLPCPRASMSAFLIAAFIIRSVETRRSSRAFIASFMALLMLSRSTGDPFSGAKTGCSHDVPRAFDGGGPEAYLGPI